MDRQNEDVRDVVVAGGGAAGLSAGLMLVLATGPNSVHQALLFRQWTGDLRYLSNGTEPSAEDRVKLAGAAR